MARTKSEKLEWLLILLIDEAVLIPPFPGSNPGAPANAFACAVTAVKQPSRLDV
jgi:hypothetical protein